MNYKYLRVESPSRRAEFTLKHTLVGPVHGALCPCVPLSTGPSLFASRGPGVVAVLVGEHQLAVRLHADLVVHLVDVLVNAASLP